MTGAMYAAIAGLKTHMQNLNVIGNNIANVNTNAYKAQRSVFRTALYTSMSGGSNGTSTTGGMNPSQIGYGVNLASVDIDMSTGNYNLTGKPLDCMIDGDGFFLVGSKDVALQIDAKDPDTLKSLTLTRVGNFDFMADDYLCDNNGNVVYGYACIGKDQDGNDVISDQLVPLRKPKMMTNSEGEVTIIYPSMNEANGRLADATSVDEDGNIKVGEDLDQLEFAQFDTVTLDPATGRIRGITTDNQVVTVGYVALGIVTNPNGVTMLSNSYYQCGDGAGELRATMLGGKAHDVMTSTTAMTNINQEYRSDGTANGGAAGGGGNQNTANLLAATKGLEYVNGSVYLYQKNADAGNNGNNGNADADDDPFADLPDGTKIYDGGQRALLTGGLESSKTDLATEISNMITTQRGYQANTRIVTVTDSMLEELVNMKR